MSATLWYLRDERVNFLVDIRAELPFYAFALASGDLVLDIRGGLYDLSCDSTGILMGGTLLQKNCKSTFWRITIVLLCPLCQTPLELRSGWQFFQMRIMDIHLQLHACGRVCCVLHGILFLRTCGFCSRGDERPRLGWRHRTCFTPFVFPRARVTIRNYLHSFPLLLQCCCRGRSLVHASFISSFRVKLLRQLSLRSYSMSICSLSPSQSTLLLCPYLLPVPPTSTLPLHPRLPSCSAVYT